MRAIQDDLPSNDFVPPGLADDQRIQVRIPDVVGMSTRRAAQRLAGAGFYVTIGERRGSEEPQGTVAETSPDIGEGATRGSTVTVHPSAGD
jgi:serine/threonine-protein kinase